jgi:hypothetical protein
MTTMQRALLRPAHVREVLGISRDEFRNLVSVGVLNPVVLKPGMRPYYARAEVEDVLRKAESKGKGES